MIQLMENIEEALLRALHFLEERAPEIPITQAELTHTLPPSNDFPCLIDFFITHYKKFSENRILPTLTYHFCSKRTAKCLVYNKTNKITGIYGRWLLMGEGTTLEYVQKARQRFGQKVITETDGFGGTLRTCLKNEEPFLLHTEIIRDSAGKAQEHQTIVNMENAKSVVYYEKNMKLVGKINVDELMNLVEKASTQGYRAKVSSIWSKEVIKSIKKKIEDETTEDETIKNEILQLY